MFDGIAEHEVAEREVAERDCFFFFVVVVFFFFVFLLFFLRNAHWIPFCSFVNSSFVLILYLEH